MVLVFLAAIQMCVSTSVIPCYPLSNPLKVVNEKGAIYANVNPLKQPVPL